MLKVVNCNNQSYKIKLQSLLKNDVLNSITRTKLVRKIIVEVRIGGDKKLINLTRKYDRNEFKTIKDLEVSNAEIEKSIKLCSKKFLKSTQLAIKRIKSYQKKLLPKIETTINMIRV